jgi:hypothetical protein
VTAPDRSAPPSPGALSWAADTSAPSRTSAPGATSSLGASSALGGTSAPGDASSLGVPSAPGDAESRGGGPPVGPPTLPAWSDVLATALVGTQRRTLTGFPATVEDPAEALLDAAAALTIYRRAAVSPHTGLLPPSPAPDDSAFPLISSLAATRLADLLAFERSARADAPVRDVDGRLELLAEWLGAVVTRDAHGRRVLSRRIPGELLPALLDIGRRHRALRPLIAAAGGTRAQWLAEQRTEWGYLRSEVPAPVASDGAALPGADAPGTGGPGANGPAGERTAAAPPGAANRGGAQVPGASGRAGDGAQGPGASGPVRETPPGGVPTGEGTGAGLTATEREVWELGAIGRRVGLLAVLRRRDPAAARALVEDAWANETPEDRAALLGALEVGLSTADEELLESALDDRRKEVRIAAVELLAHLPDSGYARRMIERTTAAVQVVGGGAAGGSPRIRINPPTACDRAMRRDGIVPRPPVGLGERAWWLEELLTRTPLRVWGEPNAFLSLPVTDEWAAVVRRGLARAAAAQRDPAWATALTGPLTEEVAAGGRPDDRLLLEALYDALPPAALATLAVGVLRRGLAGAAAVGVEHVLELCPRPWPPALVDAVFGALGDRSGRRAAGWRLAGLCELAALRMPADQVDRAAAVAAALPSDDPMTSIVGRFADTLRFRHDMLKELA